MIFQVHPTVVHKAQGFTLSGTITSSVQYGNKTRHFIVEHDASMSPGEGGSERSRTKNSSDPTEFMCGVSESEQVN
jgi:hypothetical protein